MPVVKVANTSKNVVILVVTSNVAWRIIPINNPNSAEVGVHHIHKSGSKK